MEKATLPRVLVIGGGAAGFMAAVTAAEAGAEVTLWERGPGVLAKVRISGGGRCNVTNALEDPRRFAENYPRGGKELLGAFHRFGAKDTRAWFESRGVALKTEPDGRVFPRSDDSATVVDALVSAARRAGVRVETGVSPIDLKREGGAFVAAGRGVFRADRLLLATGSGAEGHAWARAFGHTVVPPVPSLFTFAIKDPRLAGLAGGVDAARAFDTGGVGVDERGALAHHPLGTERSGGVAALGLGRAVAA
jgi:predicted Rossmann fold flavoprotein